MPQAHFRVRHDDDAVLNSITLWCRSHAKVYISVQEMGKNDGKHIHVIIDTNKTISTFRQNFIKEFPELKGNQSYSLKIFEKDLDHNIRYVCKGTKEQLPNILFKTITMDEVINAHKTFWENQKQFLIEKGVNPDKPTKKVIPFKDRVISQLPVGVPAAYSALQAMYKRSDYEEHEYQKVRKTIVNTTILSMGQYGKDCDANILTRLINGVLLKCVTDYGNKEEKEKICERLTNLVNHNLI